MAAPSKLTRERILGEAICLLREEGLDEMTLRKLAARLNVEAPSLYRHIASKRELLVLVTTRLFQEQVDRIGRRECWQDWLTAFGRIMWQTEQEIRDVSRLVIATNFRPAELDAMTDVAREALVRHGIDRGTALEMQMSVQALMLGIGSLAQGASASSLRTVVPLDDIVENTLNALVRGWEARRAEVAASQPMQHPVTDGV